MLIIFTAGLAWNRIVKQGVEVDELQFLSQFAHIDSPERGDWAQSIILTDLCIKILDTRYFVLKQATFKSFSF